MRINSVTRLVEDFELINKQELYENVKNLMQKGVISDYIKSVYEEWRLHCGLTDTQFLLCISTVFPQKILLSLIEAGFIIK